MGGEGGGASWKLKKAAKRIFVQTCASFCHTQQQTHHVIHTSSPATTPVCRDSRSYSSSSSLENQKRSVISFKNISSEIAGQGKITPTLLLLSSISSTSQAIFTAQCTHSFHFACISSNVRHGNITCPICRAHWTQLPRNLNTRCSNKTEDPVLRILDDSIANFRVHRRSFPRSAWYNNDNDDPVEPHDRAIAQPRLSFSLLAVPGENLSRYLLVKSAHQPAADLVLVVSPNGPHLRLMKHAMALVVSSLRPIDRLAIVTYSRVCPLRRMTSHGKRIALQVIDQLFQIGNADPLEGLKKGVNILKDRVHKNPESCILHLTDCPSRPYDWFDSEVNVKIHRFHVGFGIGACNGLIMREFEEFLARTLGGQVEDIQLMIGDRTMVVRIGELRGGEERNIPLYVGESGRVCVKYSYSDGECITTGENVVGMEDDDGNRNESRDVVPIGTRLSSGGNWDYHDPFMARRWAKHLHGYRL
ncbi:hypothetical protein DH2020_033176 [Rehmannia glutinosa]|uniref:RING-type domain-containing protein n=1 Tax=Rehmannia glutinosa TaxID=99300 RepID=A0ABR0VGK2_REHGL